MTLPLNDYAVVRYDLVENPSINDGSIAAGVLGKCVPKSDMDENLPYPLPNLPVYNPDIDSYVQLSLTDYTLASFAYTFFQGGYEKGVVHAGDIPPGFPLQLNTHDFAIKSVAPSIEKFYPNMTMQLSFGVKDNPMVNITEKGINIVAPSSIDFQVLNGSEVKEAFSFSCPVNIASSVTFTSDQRIAANLTYMRFVIIRYFVTDQNIQHPKSFCNPYPYHVAASSRWKTV